MSANEITANVAETNEPSAMIPGLPIVIVVVVVIMVLLAVFGSLKARRGTRMCLGRGKVEYLIDDDISNGRERHELPALSYLRHDETPLDFHYVTDHVKREPAIHIDTSLTGMTCCSCLDDCSNNDCACAKGIHCERFYDSKGQLSADFRMDAPEMIRECNVACKCNRKLCKNMVIQGGCQARLVLFRTKSRGWGVRTVENLKRGTFIGVYSGELVSVSSSQRRQDDTYLFNLSNSHTNTNTNANNDNKQQQEPEEPVDQDIVAEPAIETVESANGSEGQTDETNQEESELNAVQASEGGSPMPNDVNDDKESAKMEDEELDDQQQEELVIETNADECKTHETECQTAVESGGNFVCDAKFYGNFTRFINHSCEPNVIGIRTFTVHQDDRFPHISFFTNRNIQAGTELTLNYGDSYWLVKCKRDQVFCLCKRSKCKFNKKTLPITMQKYNEAKNQN